MLIFNVYFYIFFKVFIYIYRFDKFDKNSIFWYFLSNKNTTFTPGKKSEKKQSYMCVFSSGFFWMKILYTSILYLTKKILSNFKYVHLFTFEKKIRQKFFLRGDFSKTKNYFLLNFKFFKNQFLKNPPANLTKIK